MQQPYLITLSGEFDVFNSERLEEALAASYDHREVVVDFAGVPYVDSTALSVLVGVRKRRMEMGFPPKRFIRVPESIRTVLRVTSLDKIWPIFETLEEAAASFSRS